jgi:uncharacterized protein YjiS (DUF1127 family)
MLVKNGEWPRPAKVTPLPERVGWLRTLGRLRERVVGTLGYALEALAERRRRRQTYRALAALNDHMLKDLGITRCDLRDWTDEDIRGWRRLQSLR